MENKIFKTSIVNLEQLQKIRFTIPTYQRPYVWGDEQIKKLLEDFYKSFKDNRLNNYYIGSILTNENQTFAELIDGQQRFTTLWLTAVVFSRKNKGSQIEKILKNDDGTLKITFEVRSEVEEYFQILLQKDKNEEIKLIDSYEIAKFPYLKNIAKALVTINGIIESLPEEELKDFGDYIYNKVQLIKNTTPEKIDLNKLFSTINSAGVQLEQTDIVKSNLLKCIDEKVFYSKIWEACEDMNNFFERNVRQAFPDSNWTKLDLTKFQVIKKEVFLFEDIERTDNEGAYDIFTIDDLSQEIVEIYQEDKKYISDEKRESEEVYCRSIINFGQLLLHTYRLHLRNENLADFEGTFHINRLVEIFKDLEIRNNPAEIKRFFEILWKVRFLFDKYVIKWISDAETKTEHLELVNINKNSEHYYTRTKYAKSNILMLQSVLYFTGDYLRQFWLTTYLGYMLDNHKDFDATSEVHLTRLEKIDNDLSLCKTITDKIASLQLIDSGIDTHFDYDVYLSSAIGTKFQHYWFQKLEYILWKQWRDRDDQKFKNFRVSSKNSVEHIYPQQPKISPSIDEKGLHSFGNLVLLSVSQNSEYSNKEVNIKQREFENKPVTYDTLKSFYIFKNGNWNEETILSHEKEMLNIIHNHYSIE